MVGASRVQVVSGGHPRPGEVWVFVGADGQLIAHRCLQAGTRLRFQGDANRVPDEPLDQGQLVGRVTAVERDGRWRSPPRSERLRGVATLRVQAVLHRAGPHQPGWLRTLRARRSRAGS